MSLHRIRAYLMSGKVPRSSPSQAGLDRRPGVQAVQVNLRGDCESPRP